jgi:hypothetical protein
MRRCSTCLAVILFVLLGTIPVHGQQRLPMGAAMLQTATVAIQATNTRTGKGGTCLGFLWDIYKQNAYVVTAKHCVELLSSAQLTTGVSYGDLALRIRTSYMNGTTGTVVSLRYEIDHDVVVLRSTFDSGDRPKTHFDVCGNSCYHYTSFQKRIRILTMLYCGCGDPVLASGDLIAFGNGGYSVLLPAGHGTSGSMIVSLDGVLVGLVVGPAGSLEVDSASYRLRITPASVADELVKGALKNDGATLK